MPGRSRSTCPDGRGTAPDGYQAQRSYSIASAPELDAVELTIELVDDGEVSPYLIEVVEPGDQIELRGPIGGFFTWSAEQGGPLFLLAGGSGLVPLMAMLRHRAARRSEAEARVLISTRAPVDVLFRDELASLEPRAGLRVEHTYTREPPPDWTGHARRIDAEMLAGIDPGPGARCFVCGPTPFVERAASLLVDAGHDPASVYLERFGPTSGGPR